MIAAVVVAVGFMFAFASRISGFVERHPTMKVLALSFLLLIGATLVAEGFDAHVPKGYIYFAMAFSVVVELLNIRMRGRHAKQQEAAPEQGSIPEAQTVPGHADDAPEQQGSAPKMN
jgi:predicted tellurium resistance membrane protein TerC